MINKTFVLSFPQATVQQPIAYHLIKDYDWVVNILRARVTPNLEEKGMLVIAVRGRPQEIDAGLDYLARLGVHCEPLAQDVVWVSIAARTARPVFRSARRTRSRSAAPT